MKYVKWIKSISKIKKKAMCFCERLKNSIFKMLLLKGGFQNYINSKEILFTGIIFLIGSILGNFAGGMLGAFQGNTINAFETVSLFIIAPLLTLILATFLPKPKQTPIWTLYSFPLFGIGFGLGAFVAVAFMYLTKYVEVRLSTTFPEIINERTVSTFLIIASKPLQFLGFMCDADQMVLAAFEQRNVANVSGAISWRNFILGSIVVYTIVPRLILLLVITLKSRSKVEPTKIRDDSIFKISTEINSIEDYFQISEEELRLLLSVQFQLVAEDVGNEKDYDRKLEKIKWLEKWEEGVTQTFEKELVKDSDLLKKDLTRLAGMKYKKAKVLLFESLVFEPYFQLDEEFKSKDLKYEFNAVERLLSTFANCSGDDINLLKNAKKSFLERRKKYSSIWSLERIAMIGAASLAVVLLSWAAAPLIGAAIGSSLGLSGIAATKAGLALLGGGAVIMGGWGVAGGTAVIIGGGAVLGLGGGSIASIYLMEGGSNLIAADIAKVETVLLELLLEELASPREYLVVRLKHLAAELEEAKSSVRDSNKNKQDGKFSKLSSKEIDRSLKIVRDRISELAM